MSDKPGFGYDALEIDQQAVVTRRLSGNDIDAFAACSGDSNPLHLDADYARSLGYADRIAHGMLLAGWVSAAIASDLPGRGTVYLRQTLEFRQAALPGDLLHIHLRVTEKKRRGRVLLECRVTHDDGRDILRGVAEVIAPAVN